MEEVDRIHLAEVDCTQLIILQSREGVVSKFPSLRPSYMKMLAQNVNALVRKWAKGETNADSAYEVLISEIKDGASELAPKVKDRSDDLFDTSNMPRGIRLDASRAVIGTRILGSGSFADVRSGTFRFP